MSTSQQFFYYHTCIVSLGNPSSDFQATPHNVGYQVVDIIADMNFSGPTIRRFLEKSGHTPNYYMIVHDDMDLGFGKVRLKHDGGDAGHRGVRSVISALGTDVITRIRIGVRQPDDTSKAIHRVLTEFSIEEKTLLSPVLEQTAQMILHRCQTMVDTASANSGPLSA